MSRVRIVRNVLAENLATGVLFEIAIAFGKRRIKDVLSVLTLGGKENKTQTRICFYILNFPFRKETTLKGLWTPKDMVHLLLE
jgi:hypothetical protein